MSQPLVLSLFPGIGLLDMAFEAEGFCVVRGPDLLWGGDVKRFHPPAGKFDGVIGGPPCKGESRLAHLNGDVGATLWQEFRRVVEEAYPYWWVMEAVKAHPHMDSRPLALNNRWFGEKQNRLRYFHSNLNLKPLIQVEAFEHPEWKYAVLAGHGGAEGSIVRRMATYSWAEMCELQGLPAGFDLPGFTRAAKREAVGNGVPLGLGRAIASAVKQAYPEMTRMQSLRPPSASARTPNQETM
jgi:DNA (cytosine-5)-methyltransferase 1